MFTRQNTLADDGLASCYFFLFIPIHIVGLDMKGRMVLKQLNSCVYQVANWAVNNE